MAKKEKKIAPSEWVQKGQFRTLIRDGDDIELFPYLKSVVTQRDMRRVAKDILEWVETTQSVVVTDFCNERRICTARIYEWAAKCPEVEWAWQIAVQKIGSKREQKGLAGEYSSSIVMGTMALYSPEYRAWRERLAQKSAEGGAIKVEVQAITSEIKASQDTI